MQLDNKEPEYPFLKNRGELGILTAKLDWNASSLGSIETWPQSLRTALGILLASRIPMFMVWGSDKIFFYNDSFRPFLLGSGKHPKALGNDIRNALSSEWHTVSDTVCDMIDQGLIRSESNIIANRISSNTLHEVYLTVGYSIISSNDDIAEGVFVTCTENSAVIPDLIPSSAVRSQLNGVLMQANAGIAQANIEGRVVEVNDRYCQMLGYTREEILQMNLGELTHPEDLERNMLLLQDCIANGNDFLITKRYICRDGSIIWVNNSISIVTNPEGGKYITAIAIDITAEKEREEKLSASEARFRTLIAKAPVGTAVFRGADFHIELANGVMLEYWDKGNEVTGKRLTEVFPEVTDKDFYQRLSEVYRSGEEYKTVGAEILSDPEGSQRYFDYSLTPLLDENGIVYAVLNMSSDVTDTVKTQREIMASQNELAAIFEQSPVAIATIGIDEQLVFQSANTFYGELVGRKPGQLIGKPLLEAVPELKGQGFDELLKEVIRTGIPYTAKEVEVEVLRSGKLENIYVDLIYQVNHNAAGENSSILVVATDVTRQVLSRREVEESEAILQNLISGAPAGIGLFVGRAYYRIPKPDFY